MTFRYMSGQAVQKGDRVLTGNRTSAGNAVTGIVEQLLEPGSEAALAEDLAEGGIVIREDWDGTVSYLVLPTTEDDEDLQLISRAAADV